MSVLVVGVIMGNQMKNQVFEAEAAKSWLKYEKGGSSISELSFLRLPGGIPRRQRSNKRVRVAHNKEMSLDTGSSEVEIVQKHPGQVLSMACTGPRTCRKRTGKKVSEDFVPRGQTRRKVKINKTRQQGKLDDNIFNKYLGNLWRSFPSEKKDSFTYLDCLWFTMYGEESKRVKVLDWIKKKKIFSKNYVFLPVCKWGHWSLLIFCHLGEDLLSKTKTPCMLVLDSMQMAEQATQLEPEIRKFLLDIFKAEDRKETKELINKIPFLVPKVPQQRDNKECGNYVLYYLALFLMNAPETINISAGYPYFMKEDWFAAEGLESFCRTLDSSDEF